MASTSSSGRSHRQETCIARTAYASSKARLLGSGDACRPHCYPVRVQCTAHSWLVDDGGSRRCLQDHHTFASCNLPSGGASSARLAVLPPMHQGLLQRHRHDRRAHSKLPLVTGVLPESSPAVHCSPGSMCGAQAAPQLPTSKPRPIQPHAPRRCCPHSAAIAATAPQLRRRQPPRAAAVQPSPPSTTTAAPRVPAQHQPPIWRTSPSWGLLQQQQGAPGPAACRPRAARQPPRPAARRRSRPAAGRRPAPP